MKIDRLLYTSDSDYSFLWEYYVEFLRDCYPEKAEGLPDHYRDVTDRWALMDFEHWVDDSQYQGLHDFVDELRHTGLCDTPVVITGLLGRWNGKHEIVPCKMNDLYSALQKCFSGADSIEVWQKGSAIVVRASNHDGTNTFRVHFLNDKGCATVRGNLANRRYHQTLKKCILD